MRLTPAFYCTACQKWIDTALAAERHNIACATEGERAYRELPTTARTLPAQWKPPSQQ